MTLLSRKSVTSVAQVLGMAPVMANLVALSTCFHGSALVSGDECRKTLQQIKADKIKWLWWDFYRLKLVIRCKRSTSAALTAIAGGDVAAHGTVKARPEKIRAGDAEIRSCRCVTKGWCIDR